MTANSQQVKRIIKVKLGESVPFDAKLIKIEKEREHTGWQHCGAFDEPTYTLIEYAYYEVLS